MALINNPYLYHPHPLLKRAAGDVCSYISQHSEWADLFEQGKMLGILLVENENGNENMTLHPIEDSYSILIAYSGVINGLSDPEGYFVPPIYDLQNPDDFYLKEDAEISQINQQIAQADNPETQNSLRQLRKEKSLSLQLKIFKHFNIISHSGQYRNIVEIFADARHGLPPGGTGECAAPRLLQYAYQHHMKAVAMAEFWYGKSPKNYRRTHGQFYPSCIEKCSPLLAYMNGTETAETPDTINDAPILLYEDEHIVAVNKPAGMLSVPAKDLALPNVEGWLKERYPDCRLPFMLAHRLDQATSGLLIAAKDAQTHKLLQQAFEQKTIRKRYLAWLKGNLSSDCGIINLPICPNPDDRPRQVVDWGFGKTAISRYNVLKRQDQKTLVELFPLTGRTHQLRLHAASPFGLGVPIVGDTLYDILEGKEKMRPTSRLMLHAESLYLPQGFNLTYLHADASTFQQ